jgi:hypothetical protein
VDGVRELRLLLRAADHGGDRAGEGAEQEYRCGKRGT